MENYFSTDLPIYLFFGKSQEKIFKVRLLGWHKGVFLLTSFPSSTDSNNILKIKDSKCIVRLIYKGKVVSFETKVLKHKALPTPQLYLEYPQKVTLIKMRKSKRYKTSIKGRVQDMQTKEWIACIVIDISKEGCRIVYSSDSNLNFDKRVLLAIKDKTFGIISGIYIEKRNEISNEQSIQVGCEIVYFSDEEVRRKYEELVGFHSSLTEIFKETASKINSIFIE